MNSAILIGMFRSLFLLLVALAAVPAPPTAQTPTLQVFNQWLAAINSGDAAKMTAFWQKFIRESPELHVSQDQRLLKMTGGFTLLKVNKDDGSHLEVLMKERRGSFAVLVIDLASTNPPLIKRLFAHPAPDPASSSVPAGDDAALAAQVRSHANDLAVKDAFSGAILIAHKDKVVLDQAWGMADREKQVENTVDTQFCIGSMNKMFTAVAVLQLVQQGKLSLDGTISDYWPDYPNHDLAKQVKIKQLLSHTGGTGDIFTPEYKAHRLEIRSLADYVKLFGERPVSFQPGSRMEYSNYGFILLGRLIEIVTGQSYDTYVREHIFEPAGMTHTDSRPESGHVPGRAIGYAKGPSGLHPNTDTLPWSGTPAGGGYSTVGDLFLFANALQSGKLLDQALLREATTDQSHAGYGFGFYSMDGGVYGHGGGGPGINGEMHIIPAKNYVVVVLANRDPFMATEMETFIESGLPNN